MESKITKGKKVFNCTCFFFIEANDKEDAETIIQNELANGNFYQSYLIIKKADSDDIENIEAGLEEIWNKTK